MSAHLGSGLALDVQVARRDLGLSVAEVAASCGVEEDALRAVEQGDAPDVATALALCAWLGLDEGRHVPGRSDPHDPEVTGPRRARVRAVLRHAPALDGLVVFPEPDVAAGLAVPRSPSLRARVVSAVRRSVDVDRVIRWGLVTLGASVVVPGTFGLLDLRGPAVVALQAALVCVGLCLMIAPCVLGLLWLAWRDLGPKRAAPQGGPDAYLLSSRGASSLTVQGDGLLLRDTLARRVGAVSVEGRGPGHVTLVVDGDQGTFELPCLRRTRDLSDAVAAWGAPVLPAKG